MMIDMSVLEIRPRNRGELGTKFILVAYAPLFIYLEATGDID